MVDSTGILVEDGLGFGRSVTPVASSPFLQLTISPIKQTPLSRLPSEMTLAPRALPGPDSGAMPQQPTQALLTLYTPQQQQQQEQQQQQQPPQQPQQPQQPQT